MLKKFEWKKIISILLVAAMILQTDMPVVTAAGTVSDSDAGTVEEIAAEETEPAGETETGTETENTNGDEISDEADAEPVSDGDAADVASGESAATVEVVIPQAPAADGIVSTGDYGTMGKNNGIHWAYNAARKTLTVSGGDELCGVKEEGKDFATSPFSGRAIDKIVFRDCTLTGSAFCLFYSLSVKELDLSGLDTSAVTDMSGMFANCRSLKKLDLSKLNTAAVTDMKNMFADCISLESLDLSKFSDASVKNMQRMFSGCLKLKTLNVSKFTSGKVENTAEMFKDCKALTELTVSGLNTAAVTDMQSMFSGCAALKALDVSKFDTGKVTTMQGLFRDCKALTALDVSKFNTAAVTDMQDMFNGCAALTALDVSGFETGKVTSMQDMFNGCAALTSLNLSGVKTGAATNMKGLFNGCSALTTLDVAGFDTSKVTDMSDMFASCAGLTALDVSAFNTAAVTDMNRMFFGCKGLKSLDVSRFKTDAVTRMDGMFANCGGLTSLDLGNFNTAAVTDMSNMFASCTSMSSVNVKSFNTEKVTKMAGMFSNCKVLLRLDLRGFNTALVTTMQGMFNSCNYLFSLDVSEFDTSKVRDMGSMFNSCSSLTRLDLSSFDTSLVNRVEDMFALCSKLSVLITPQKTGKTPAKLPVTFYDGENNAYDTVNEENAGKELAIVKPSKMYVVHYNGNGAESGTMSDQLFEIGREQRLIRNAFKRTGYTANTWNTKADGSGKSYRNGVSANNITTDAGGNVTLYAQWIPHMYDIKYDGNGADKGTKMSKQEKCRSGNVVALKANKFTKKGYIFAGWDWDESVTQEVVAHEQHYGNRANIILYPTVSTITITLKARWIPKSDAYTVTYNMDGGINHASNPDYYLKSDTENGKSITLADPVKKGYDFKGWFPKKTGGTEVKTISGTGNKTLYARWSAHKYTIKFDGNGATNNATMSNLAKKSYAAKVKLSTNKFKKDGYTFSGWNTEADGTGIAYKDKAYVTGLTDADGGVVTLYAQWTPEKYTITYKLNGGKNAPGNPVRYHSKTATIVLETPTKTGYTFEGWFSDSKFNNAFPSIRRGSSGKKTVYAKWSPNTYTIIFDGNGAENGSMEAKTGCVYGKSFKLTGNTYNRTGYTFAGWYLNPDCKGKKYSNKASVKNLTSEPDGTITLYAKWKKK